MKNSTRNQNGFIVEALLIILVLAVIGFGGYYVWHRNHKTPAQTQSASKVTTFAECQKAAGSITQQTYPETCVTKDGKSFTDISATSSHKYLVIKQWGVEAAYSGSDTLSYTINTDTPDIATIISANLAAQYDCTNLDARQIERFTANENVEDGPTASQAAASNPTAWGHVGGYYYSFLGDNSACSEKQIKDNPSGSAQINANHFTESLVPRLQAVPQS